jgi:hypothetical protein
MGMDFAFLLGADDSWTTGEVLPIFDWHADADRATAAWAGHLTLGQWNQRVATLLRAYFEQSFSRIPAELRDPLAARVAGISVYGSENPVDSNLLSKYISIAAEEFRRKFASTVDQILQKESAEFGETQWERWIRRYWRSRLDSLPLPLDKTEAGEMVNWVFAAGKYLSEAVALATESEAEIPNCFLFFRRIKDSPLADETVPAAQLVAHVLSGASSAGMACADMGQGKHSGLSA